MVRIVAGLGNPGRDYNKTRHNIGFAVADELVARMEGVSQRTRFRATVSEGFLLGHKLIVVKPQMYMNLSGIPIQEVVNWYKSNLDELLVVFDEMDLPLGQLRMRADGSPGGHNGVKSIVQELGTQEFSRLRIGIGRGGGASVAHVLSRFTADETAAIAAATRQAADAVALWAAHGVLFAMNEVNRPAAEPEPAKEPQPS